MNYHEGSNRRNEDDDSPLPPYQYMTLPDRESIRLVHFDDIKVQGSPSASMRFLRMSVHPVNELPEYTAISYTWGCPISDPSANSPDSEWNKPEPFVMIDGTFHKIHKNLMHLIQMIGRHKPEGYFWIDAICINQEDDNEKGNQILLMTDIYEKAKEVIVWLGRDSEEADTLFNAVKMLWLAIYRELPRKASILVEDVWKWLADHDPLDAETAAICGINSMNQWKNLWAAFFRVFERYTWFSRTWIIQEIQVARRATWWCNGLSGDWKILCSFGIDLKKADWIRRLQPASILLDYNPISMFSILKQRTTRFESESSSQFAQSIYGAINEEQRWYAYLLYLVSHFRPSQAKLPVDKIYATLSMAASGAKSTPNEWIKPDYGKEVQSVYKETTNLFLEKLPLLAVLSLVEVRIQAGVEHLPSWVPDYSVPSSFKPLIQIGAAARSIAKDISTKHARASLLEMTENSRPWMAVELGKIYDASLTEDGRNSETPRVEEDRLFLKGARFDTIEAIHIHEANDEKDILPLLLFCSTLPETHPRLGQPRQEVLWRTMIADTWITHPAPNSGSALFQLTIALQLGQLYLAQTLNRAYYDNDQHAVDSLVDHLNDTAPDVMPPTELVETFYHDEESSFYNKLGALLEQNDCVDFDDSRLKEVQGKAREFSDAAKHMMRGRLLYRTSGGYLGLGHRSARPGDEVWLLMGAKVPFVLRRRDHGTYSLVGETYLHGFMHGEMLSSELRSRLGEVCIT